MNPQKVLLIDGSNFFREMLRRLLEKSSEFEVVGELPSYYRLTSTIRRTRPDWIIISIPPGGKLPEEFRHLVLTDFPHLHLMGISADGGEVRIEWLGIREKDFQGINFETLINILHTIPID